MYISKTEKLTREYINENLENSKKLNYKDLTERDGLVKCFYEDLPKTVISGYPTASHMVSPKGKIYNQMEFIKLPKAERDKCKLEFYYLPNYHEMYIGATGSGKTTGCVEPQLRAISYQKNKPNLFITDPKGEIFSRNAKHLKEQGYEIFIMNFKDINRSDKWNPLIEVYDMRMNEAHLEDKIVMHTGPVDSKLDLCNQKKAFSENGWLQYEKLAFADAKTCELFLQSEKERIEADIDSILAQIVNMMITVQSNQDKTWEFGAQSLLRGIIWLMLDEAIDPESGFTKDMMTLKTIHEFYLTLRNDVLGQKYKLREHPLLKNKADKTISDLACALDNAPNTMRSYCGVFDNSTADWFLSHILALTTGMTVDLTKSETKPFAIFIITRDYEKSDFKIAGLFIDWTYRQMLEKAEKGLSTRPMHFMLDEFGNIPKIKDLENKIATARSRNIWFHLIIQSYSQIKNIYTDNIDLIIRDNCNSQIFLGCTSFESKEIFSKECGKHSIPTLASKIVDNDYSFTEVNLIPLSDLDIINPGMMYIKRLYQSVFVSQYIRSYTCAEQNIFKNFDAKNSLIEDTPISIDPINTDKYTFKKLHQFDSDDHTSDDFDF